MQRKKIVLMSAALVALTLNASAARADEDTLPSGAPKEQLNGKRFKRPTEAEMTPEQKVMAHNVLTGPRGSLNGPFTAYLQSPDVGDALQKVGAIIRFQSTFPVGLRELAVCQVARHWGSAYEWAAHSVQAVTGGISPDIVKAIGENRTPPKMNPEEAAIYNFTKDLLEKHVVTDEHFAAVQSRWGNKGVMDLTGAIGYFVVVAMALNVDEYPAPKGANPLPRLAR